MIGLRADLTVVRGEHEVTISLVVDPGETVAVVGPNGAGKTTVLRALAGLTPPIGGVVELDGVVLTDTARDRHLPPEARSIGMVFQDLRLFDSLDVLDNVAFGLRSRGESRRAARIAAAGWLERFGIDAVAGTPVRSLSGGEAQRVALARALAPAPRLLLLDEPLASLDAEIRPRLRRQVREHLDLHGGPCIVVTHDPLDAAVLADRVVVLEDGFVTDSGRLADLVARPRSAWAAELAGTNLLEVDAVGARLRLASGAVLHGAEPVDDGRALVAIRPASVTLHRSRPEGSARNVWSATVAEVEGYGERARVSLVGEIELVAEVTTAAVHDLALTRGTQVWASVKATDLVTYPA